MKKIFFLSPLNVAPNPHLFNTMEKTFIDNGYTITNDESNRDILFVDLYSYQAKIDLKYNLGKNIVLFDFTDRGGMSHEPDVDWDVVSGFAHNVIYFMRKMDKTKSYPSFVYPIEHIIEYDFPPVTKEELLNREYDICWIGNESPQRRNVVKGLQDSGFKMDVHWTNEKGKIPHDEWLNRHRNAKMFLTADGGGFGDERIYQLGTIAAIMKQRNNQLILNDFKDGVDCVKTDEIAMFFYQRENSLLNTDWLYNIYLKGIEKLHTYYNETYRAKYIISILKANDL